MYLSDGVQSSNLKIIPFDRETFSTDSGLHLETKKYTRKRKRLIPIGGISPMEKEEKPHFLNPDLRTQVTGF